MHKTGRILLSLAALSVFGAGLVALLAQEAPPQGEALPPIVFASRAHLETLNDHDVGPPIEIRGRELTPGGKLQLLESDGRVVTLAGPHNGIFDAQQPAVSPDGRRVVFSAVKARNGMWRLFEVGIDGAGLRQLTPEDRGFAIPDDPSRPKQNQSTFGRFGDFSPAYLPDGRIVFSSSRYPTTSGSCGERGLTLYVIDSDGRNLHRIVSTRSGALNPWVMADGRILFAFWADNMNAPSYYTEGMQPLDPDVNFGPSFFEPWAVNPDGSGTGRVGFLGGLLTHGSGGGQHFREMPNGEIVYTRRGSASLLGSTLTCSIAKFRPGDGKDNTPEGIGDPVNLDAPHACTPSPLADGRILFSYTPESKVWRDAKGRTVASFDFGLWVAGGDFQNPRRVFDAPGTHELDPVAVVARKSKLIPDEIRYVPPEDPTVTPSGVAVFVNSSVYADLDRRHTSVLGPIPGSVVALDVYDDSQTFYTTPEFPLVRKQMPRFWKSFPVNPDGSFRAEIPTDRPVVYFLRGPTGVAARYPGSLGEIRTPMFGHEQLRPGEVIGCTGCHRGHMIRPELSARSRVNMARLASAVASSTKNSSYMAAGRAVDGNYGAENGNYQWVPAATDVWPWVRLVWEQAITARQIILYPPQAPRLPEGDFEVYLSDGKRITGRFDPSRPDELVTVNIPNPGPIRWAHLQILGYPSGGMPGIAEIEVTGDPVQAAGDAPPAPVPSVTLTAPMLRLSWTRSPSRSVLGYKIFAGTSPDRLDMEFDVGNVSSYQPECLEAGQRYWFQIRAYDSRRFSEVQKQELSGTPAGPRVDSITPAKGPFYGDTEVTIEGDNFVSGVYVRIGTTTLRNVKVVSPKRITGTTYRHSVGTWDVLVRNPGRLESVLPKAFRYE